ncbi:hypothetical protein [Bradyrhizobium sp. Ce-3]|uniref:hypothetical protein n=1 Tax=Bradyrhizobium sp. Ce-3 TaxID=2913970 RepID=UPI001FC7F371|nr:hypothetical protein [Bradyrhizobium sp. Ce-3]
MEWWFYALVAIVLIGCVFVIRARRGSSSNEDEELNRRINERVDRLRHDLALRDTDRDQDS